ncbi:MAG: AP protein [Armatimonadota bacterium]
MPTSHPPISRRGVLGGLAGLAALATPSPAAAQRGRSGRHAFLVLIDGLRWQEVFRGADETLLSKEAGGVGDPDALRREFWRPTAAERRQVLMPFLWSTVASRGQILGNRDRGSQARVTNGFHFSYPGYSEMIVGYQDPRIDSNDKRPNPNVTVFEWLHGKPGFRNRVAAFGMWDVVPYIVNQERAGFYVNAGWDPVTVGKLSEEQKLINRLKAELPRHPWRDYPYDALPFRAMMEYVKANRPRAAWLTLGETDEWAHSRRYDLYLDAARRTDGFLKTLWETLQSMPEYRDRTTLLVAVDHGRGRTGKDWTSHGNDIPGADEIWLAALGPEIAPLGERAHIGEVTQAQIAATLAAALGHDYHAEIPKAAPPIAELFKTGTG